MSIIKRVFSRRGGESKSSKASSKDSRKSSYSNAPEVVPDGINKAAASLKIGPNDSVIAVMGVTGTGKSTFIEALTNAGVRVGEGLAACTQELTVYAFRYTPTRTIYLIDTPGFDDTTRDDSDILAEVSYFLGAVYKKEIKLAGIIYLHRITDNRMGGTALKNLIMFRKLCGDNTLSNIVLATNMWDAAKDNIMLRKFERWEDDLKRGYWRDMLAMGSTMFRHTGGVASARRIIDHIMSLPRNSVVPDIATQMVDHGMRLNQTPAGMEVLRGLAEQQKRHEKALKDLEDAHQQAIRENNTKMQQILEEREREQRDKLRKIEESMHAKNSKLTADFERLQSEGQAKLNDTIRKLEQDKQVADRRVQEGKDSLARLEKELQDLRNSPSNNNWVPGQESAEIRALKEEIARIKADNANNAVPAAEAANKKSMVGPILSAIGGAGLFVGGLVTANPILVGTGVGTFTTACASSAW
ncbi:P-loop containing nucleoside triphosphate hydrolase protein [Podospora australis]|uniref:P-loop containing nucleoside triphosphate hydrolase protein n=1 Tax=Podospora australis TaxID=1536484 RepID=A0AAN6WMA4_9PEZI|nr:P-loop containing nucleoside triphosphate hydrolase protein [Podospora australis]